MALATDPQNLKQMSQRIYLQPTHCPSTYVRPVREVNGAGKVPFTALPLMEMFRIALMADQADGTVPLNWLLPSDSRLNVRVPSRSQLLEQHGKPLRLHIHHSVDEKNTGAGHLRQSCQRCDEAWQ